MNAPRPDAAVVQDLATLKALAHPTRVEALGRLRSDGPATASELADVLGESRSSLSYHLRQLARFGFVTDDEARDGRERRWRAAHRQTSLPSTLATTPAARAALDVVKQVQRRSLGRGLELADDDPTGPWEHSDYLVRVDDDELAALQAELRDVVERYRSPVLDVPRAERDEPAWRTVAVHLVSVPRDDPSRRDHLP